jgi:hypothetical protein
MYLVGFWVYALSVVCVYAWSLARWLCSSCSFTKKGHLRPFGETEHGAEEETVRAMRGARFHSVVRRAFLRGGGVGNCGCGGSALLLTTAGSDWTCSS